MSDNKLEKRAPSAVKEKVQYFLAFGVVASMLLVANFPFFVVFFFGIFGYFLFRMFASGSRHDTREIFEFYLTANEVLRDDERRWYGFEIREAIQRGESLLQRMNGAPPLVHFALGALHNKAGDHSAAVNHLAYVLENESGDESAFAFPSPELRSYVKVLRKIEREPADAPLTSAAVRALERARKIRGKTLLEESRAKVALTAELEAAKAAEKKEKEAALALLVAAEPENEIPKPQPEFADGRERRSVTDEPPRSNGRSRKDPKQKRDPFADRKPISEVLHDIYDRNVQ